MRCFVSVLLLAAVAYAAVPDLDRLCKDKYDEDHSSGGQTTLEPCKVKCVSTKHIVPDFLYLEDGATCAEGKSCLTRKCVRDDDVQACKDSLKDEPLDHIHSEDCVVKCHAADRSKDTSVPRPDGASCGMFSIGTCTAGSCLFKKP